MYFICHIEDKCYYQLGKLMRKCDTIQGDSNCVVNKFYYMEKSTCLHTSVTRKHYAFSTLTAYNFPIATPINSR